MSSLTSPECVPTLEKYLKTKLYTALPLAESDVHVYYNTLIYDIFTVIPIENKEKIALVEKFSDYITLVTNATNKPEIADLDATIGVIYIDPSAEDAIVIAKAPSLRSISPADRQNFIAECNKFTTIFRPFWDYQRKNQTSNKVPSTLTIDSPTKAIPQTTNTINKNTPAVRIPDDPKKLEKGRLLIEKAIDNYCVKNNFSKDLITSTASFKDHLLPDIFKYKISVAEEQAANEDIANLKTTYPENFLKILIKMGYLE